MLELPEVETTLRGLEPHLAGQRITGVVVRHPQLRWPSGSFLANTYSGNDGNLDLGTNMVNWLASEEEPITIHPRAMKSSAIILSKTKLAVISGGFLLVLPALLVLVGCLMRWHRRQQG